MARLKDSSGAWVDKDDLPNLARHYFERIFATTGVHFNDDLSGMQRLVSNSTNDDLLRGFMVEEVKDAIFSMAPDKSPGPDGF